MPQLTEAQLAWLHAEVGTRVNDAELQAKFDRLESVRDVAIECLRERRTTLIDSPLTVSVDGVASMSNAENVKAIERRIGALVRLDDDPSDDPPVGDGPDAAPVIFQPVQMVRTRGR